MRSLPFMEEILADLRRFAECVEDNNDVNLERSRFDLLTQLGLLERVQRSPARWMMTQAGEDAIAPSAAGEPIQVEAVAVTRTRKNGGLALEWLIEGGISALEAPDVVLLVAHGAVTDDQGGGEVYLVQPPAAHGDEVLESAQNDLARAMSWIEKFRGMFGAIADGSAFYLSTAAEGRRRCQGILVRYEQDQAVMHAQGDEGAQA